MAIVAGDVHVGAVQNEISLSSVIKQPQIPGHRVVTTTAVLFEIATVRVVFLMAGDALDVGLGKDLTEVAGLAFDVAMFSEQRESGQIV